MTIFIDADACPKPIKEILFKAADREQISCVFIANHAFYYPNSPYIKTRIVDKGFDIADNYIISKVASNDLVITSDIPLASEVIKKGAIVISSSGKIYTKSNIAQALAMRNFFTEMRDAGMIESKSKPFNQKNSHAFAKELDKYLHGVKNK
ncbi:YaiI/YqxD family protein [Fangia hongkongensis]|uniref:YaiI/YqxD family protein n=1 Tax=Fangia hongkongensis TaxID=270495 RepID=UPI0003721A0B|nr:YaiI/YqxD family protein [Fangia hongkongensis]MBK2124196.1 YaiI/YqxD family protein [Fangia hongkongensis]